MMFYVCVWVGRVAGWVAGCMGGWMLSCEHDEAKNRYRHIYHHLLGYRKKAGLEVPKGVGSRKTICCQANQSYS